MSEKPPSGDLSPSDSSLRGAPSEVASALELDLLSYLSSEDFDSPDARSFEELARRIFAHQFEKNLAYRRFCLYRGADPSLFRSWRDAPPVPTDAFKVADLTTFPGVEAARTFLTSGTTQGARGRHSIASLRPYERAALPLFKRYMLPGDERMPLLALLPPPEEQPESSLSFMVGYLMEQLGGGGSKFYWSDGKTELDALIERLDAAVVSREPVMLLGTSFAFVHLFDERPSWSIELPAGSRIMETGGLKGRSREVSRPELYRLFGERLRVPDSHCLAEYGMTELSSQMYDAKLSNLSRGISGESALMAPPWLKWEVVSPETLEPVPEGEVGVVRFFDLANLDSVCAIVTSDLGRRTQGGLELLGRAPNAEARGCSLTAEELLGMGGGAPGRGE